MDRIEAISKCRYYSGETECPYQVESLQHYWWMERAFVVHHGEKQPDLESLYKAIGGKEYKGIPRELLMTMFGYWGKGTYDIAKELPAFYNLVDDYLKIASENFPIDKIPHNIK